MTRTAGAITNALAQRLRRDGRRLDAKAAKALAVAGRAAAALQRHGAAMRGIAERDGSAGVGTALMDDVDHHCSAVRSALQQAGATHLAPHRYHASLELYCAYVHGGISDDPDTATIFGPLPPPLAKFDVESDEPFVNRPTRHCYIEPPTRRELEADFIDDEPAPRLRKPIQRRPIGGKH